MTKPTNLAAGLVSVLLLAATTTARAAAVDVSGTWDVEIEIAGQQGAPQFELKQEGEKITGKYKGQFGEAPLTGKIEGNEIEFSFEVQEGAKAVYTGTLQEDGTLKGTADYAGQATGEWTGKKRKADSSRR